MTKTPRQTKNSKTSTKVAQNGLLKKNQMQLKLKTPLASREMNEGYLRDQIWIKE
ncbi:36770_t:CDS:1, partial [Racocetra persica]